MIFFFKKILKYLFPKSLCNKLNVETFSIEEFIKFSANKIKVDEIILDAGAGSCPYEKYFAHTKYESTDFENIFEKDYKESHDFICSLDNIPKPNDHYDAIINTQVLEHVECPQKVINEFFRVLKTNGKLFLTAPQGWGVHGAPYHFFNFTKYGLELLFKNAGFKIIFIKPRGGIFWYLSNRIKMLPSYIYDQYRKEDEYKNFVVILKQILLFPFYIISLPFCLFLIPFLFYYLDRLDKKQDYCLGYACYCVKEEVK